MGRRRPPCRRRPGRPFLILPRTFHDRPRLAGPSHIHLIIAELTGNAALRLFVDVLARLTPGIPPADPAAAAARQADVRHAHERIVEAIVAGDSSLARHRMLRHLQGIGSYLQEIERNPRRASLSNREPQTGHDAAGIPFSAGPVSSRPRGPASTGLGLDQAQHRRGPACLCRAQRRRDPGADERARHRRNALKHPVPGAVTRRPRTRSGAWRRSPSRPAAVAERATAPGCRPCRTLANPRQQTPGCRWP
jgi:FCD domain